MNSPAPPEEPSPATVQRFSLLPKAAEYYGQQLAAGLDGEHRNGLKGFALVRREWEPERPGFQCCRGDEGRPLEVGVQELASNQAVPL